MSTTNFYDIPEYFREKLNTQALFEKAAATVAQSEEEPEHIEDILSAQSGSCRNGNCAPPPSPCRNGNCAPPPPPCRNGQCVTPPPPRPPYPQYPFHPCPMGGTCRRKNNWMTPMPFFRAYPGSLRMQNEMDDWQDWDNLRERYPKNAKMIKMLVDEQADRMEYDGSMMFDEYPDEMRIEKVVDEIYMRLLSELENQITDSDDDTTEDGKEMLEDTCTKCNNAWSEEALKELITVLLYQEMYLRRCKNRRCNRWW